MAKLSNFFFKMFGKLNIKETGDGYKISLNMQPVGAKVDLAQYALDTQVWQDVQKYMPRDTGTFISDTNALNATQTGKVYLYPPESPQGHYLYEGILYVDPITGKGAFYDEEYGFWSRPNVAKIPSDRKLTYSNPYATPNWGKTAIDNHKDDWLKVVKRSLE